ncbi:RH-like protein isoform X2 [Rhineura floridana]|uniref:RH-like protein isoform X2 n=1 Tax=Rhineura floridana TaxID=261503 RepID=UPI002AC81F9F|nr:RH-like protein isoform X2 [Rhineura floridana]
MPSQYPPSLRIHLPAFILFLEAAFILIFVFFISYDHQSVQNDLAVYPAFQDVNIMVILGFAFLLAFLRRYGFSSTGFSLCLAACGVQWAVIVDGFLFHFSDGQIKINLQSFLAAVMSIAAVLISAGAILGKANLMQLLWMALVEVTVFAVNRWLAVDILGIKSHTSLMHVHLFGTYFGLTVSWKLCPSSLSPKVEKERSQPVSDMFAMLGTLFLWVFWPSFNSVLIEDGREKQAAICNTYFAMAASAVAAFSLSVATSSDGKFRMTHIRNATLAGGVALGFSAPIIQHPWIAMTLGLAAGAVSVLGFAFLQKRLQLALWFHDTCGVHYTFGFPSLLGGIAHIILLIIDGREDLSGMAYSTLSELGAFALSMALGLIAGLVTDNAYNSGLLWILELLLFLPSPLPPLDTVSVQPW